MPSLDVSMARSLRRGLLEQLTVPFVRRSAAAALSKRDLISQAKDGVTDAKTAFSSWENCIQASFCKWPVIAVIVIGGLIVFSVLWCIARCACCSRACCCSAFECLKCCGNCCGCCDPPGGRRHKYKDDPYTPPNQAYQRNAPMQTPPGMAASAYTQQYAEFDMTRKGSDDSLPHMPSWEGSNSRKVMVEDDDVELDILNKGPVSITAPLLSPSTSSCPPTPVSAVAPNGMYAQARNGSADYFSTASPSAKRAEPSPLGPRPPPLRSYSSKGQQDQNAYGTNHDPDGYGLDEPYDDPAPSGNPRGSYASMPTNASGFAGPPGLRQPSPALGRDRDGYGQLPRATTRAGT